MAKICLAGGCFWGVEKYFALIKGVTSTKVGYAQSTNDALTYDLACSQKFNAVEAVMVDYEMELDELLSYYYKIIDPTLKNRQGNDIGIQYRTGVYCFDEQQMILVKSSLDELQKSYDSEVVVECELLDSFIDGEEYHQSYLDKNPLGYCHVDFGVLKKDDLK